MGQHTVLIAMWVFLGNSVHWAGYSSIHLLIHLSIHPKTHPSIHLSAYLSSVSMCTSSCPSLCSPVDCGLPDSSVNGISQATILEWVAISYSIYTARIIMTSWSTEPFVIV